MSEDRFDNVMRELREAAPPAPDELRERVSALREQRAKRVWALRPALVAAAAIALTVGLGAAAVGGLTGSGTPEQNVLRGASARTGNATGGRGEPLYSPEGEALAPMDKRARTSLDSVLSKRPPFLTGSRLQQHVVAMNLRVKDLSASTQAAVRHTRRLGGY